MVAYADPPYPGKAGIYRNQPDYSGEVDHAALLRTLAGFDGWALSTSADALREVLPLCPPEAKVCAWTKPIGPAAKAAGLANTWEPLIVLPARQEGPPLRDWICTQPARRRGDLIGRKPIRFVAFMFAAIGLRAGDELVDLYPGTGIVSRLYDVIRAANGLDIRNSRQLSLFSADG